MAGSETPAPGVVPAALLVGLVDDAALFPPALLPLRRALAEHAQHRNAWYAPIVGPFLCPATAVTDLQATLDDQATLRVVLIAPPTVPDPVAAIRGAAAQIAADRRLNLAGVELPAPGAGTLAAAVERLDVGVPVWLEVDRSGDWRGAVDAIAALDGAVYAKLRMRGADTAASPADSEVAAFLEHTVATGVPFKLTAGLHHAVRFIDAQARLPQHGFLNVLCAVHLIQQRADTEQVLVALADADPVAVAAMVRNLSVADAVAVRGMLQSFGCCGVRDPVADLVALGLLEHRTHLAPAERR